MAPVNTFPCLGVTMFGMCSYNPSQPTIVYFSIGEALAALGFILAIQQFLRPLYLFRLRAYGINLWHIFSCIFCGFLCVVFAALLPNLPIRHVATLEYPIMWELIGAGLIGLAYCVAAYISLSPARAHSWNLLLFVRAAARLLSEAEDSDRVGIATDLSENMTRLLAFSRAIQKAEDQAYKIEFDRLRQLGAPPIIQGRIPISPFYAFAFREELRKASAAAVLLRILSDQHFCTVLVAKCPWLTAGMIRELGNNDLPYREASGFVQGIARQAISSDESMLDREFDYEGFSAAPLLSESLFGSLEILSRYDPLSGLRFLDLGRLSDSYVERLMGACKMIVETAAAAGDFWPQRYMRSVEGAFENLFHANSWRHLDPSSRTRSQVSMGIERICDTTVAAVGVLSKERVESLFLRKADKTQMSLVSCVASIVYECLASFANSFDGHLDDNWVVAIGLIMEIYPMSSGAPAGMNPLQQQLAVKLLEKLNQNMEGWYPAISRVLLATLGPYETDRQSGSRTALVIFKDAVYKSLQRLPLLNSRSPEKLKSFFPANVSYDPAGNVLNHTYSGGDTRTTDLAAIVVPDVNLFSRENWNI